MNGVFLFNIFLGNPLNVSVEEVNAFSAKIKGITKDMNGCQNNTSTIVAKTAIRPR